MPRIRIVKVPWGDAPEEVKKSWVGIELDAKEGPVLRGFGSFTKPWEVHERMVYVVNTTSAFLALKEKDWMAAAWFYELPRPIGPVLYFLQDDCEEIASEAASPT